MQRNKNTRMGCSGNRLICSFMYMRIHIWIWMSGLVGVNGEFEAISWTEKEKEASVKDET